MKQLPVYVIVTPARNEAEFIERTLRCVVAQSCLPAKWVIVDDGSTDQTAEIVRRYADQFDWIHLISRGQRSGRDFAGKVHAFNAGMEIASKAKPQVIVNLDADVEIVADHFEYLLSRSLEAETLGVWGPAFREGDMQYDYRFSNIENVWGGCQMFRSECFQSIGGYRPMKGGGIDHLAVVMARMHGWKTRTFPERVCNHLRVMGTAQRGKVQARFKMGMKDHSLGNHPLWEVSRVAYQMTKAPLLVGGAALGAGYLWSALSRGKSQLDPSVRKFIHKEQMSRLKRALPGGRILRQEIHE